MGNRVGSTADKDDALVPVTSPEFMEQFELGDNGRNAGVGIGGFSYVIRAKFLPTKQQYALKVIDKEHCCEEGKAHRIKGVMQELLVHRDLDHSFIIGLDFAFQDDAELYLALPLMPGGSLSGLLKAQTLLSEADALFYTKELILAVEYLGRVEIVHRDIKPENILIDGQGHIKLCDFSIAERCTTPLHAPGAAGTQGYVAPEVIQDQSYQTQPDWWGVGVTLFELLTGQLPFAMGSGRQVRTLARRTTACLCLGKL